MALQRATFSHKKNISPTPSGQIEYVHCHLMYSWPRRLEKSSLSVRQSVSTVHFKKNKEYSEFHYGWFGRLFGGRRRWWTFNGTKTKEATGHLQIWWVIFNFFLLIEDWIGYVSMWFKKREKEQQRNHQQQRHLCKYEAYENKYKIQMIKNCIFRCWCFRYDCIVFATYA